MFLWPTVTISEGENLRDPKGIDLRFRRINESACGQGICRDSVSFQLSLNAINSFD